MSVRRPLRGGRGAYAGRRPFPVLCASCVLPGSRVRRFQTDADGPIERTHFSFIAQHLSGSEALNVNGNTMARQRDQKSGAATRNVPDALLRMGAVGQERDFLSATGPRILCR